MLLGCKVVAEDPPEFFSNRVVLWWCYGGAMVVQRCPLYSFLLSIVEVLLLDHFVNFTQVQLG